MRSSRRTENSIRRRPDAGAPRPHPMEASLTTPMDLAESPVRRWVPPVLLLAVNVCALAVLGIFAFRRNQATLLYGLDGSYMMTIVKQQVVWAQAVTGFTNNYFQSLGNIWMPQNMNLIPGYALSVAINGGEVDPIVSYVMFSIEVFLSAYVVGKLLRFSDILASFSSWGLTLSVMPYFGYPKVYAVLGICPQFATVMLLIPMLLILYRWVGRIGLLGSSACLAGMTFLLIYLTVSQAIVFILVVPVLAVFGTCLVSARFFITCLYTIRPPVRSMVAFMAISGLRKIYPGASCVYPCG